MNHIIQQVCPACGHNRNSVEHRRQKEKCSKIKKQMREAGQLKDEPLERKVFVNVPNLRAGYGTQSRSYRE